MLITNKIQIKKTASFQKVFVQGRLYSADSYLKNHCIIFEK